MKKTYFFTIILCMNSLSYSLEKLKPHPRPKPEMTVTSLYLTIKELLCIYLVMPFWLDLDSVKNCSIYCSNCEREFKAFECYGYFAAQGNYKVVYNFKRLLYKSDVDQIHQYLLKITTEEEIECVTCRDYCGWHLKI